MFGFCLTLSSEHLVWGTRSTHRIAINIISTLSVLYPLTGLLLFFILSYASLFGFQSIQMEIKTARQLIMDDRNIDPSDVAVWLQTFKRRHIIACSEAVECVNRCSGWTLLISTIFTFLSAINNSFYFFGHDIDLKVTDVVFYIFTVVLLTSMCCTADRVTNQVYSAGKLQHWDIFNHLD